jgi:hypothetical protein
MRALMSAGARLVLGSGFLILAIAVSGLQSTWLDWGLTLAFLAGMTDIAIAAGFNVLSAARDDDGESQVAIEFGRDGIKLWWGGEAGERRAEYLEARERGTSRRAPAAWPDTGLRWAYPAGLSCRPPYGAPWPSEKRLAPPPSARWQDPGIEFPEPPVHNLVDRHGVRTSPFPVHFRTEPESHELVDGVRMAPAVMRYHTDSGNPGCPVCETWERKWGVFHG